MGCDLVVALGQATAEGQTLFGQNSHRPVREQQALKREPGRSFALGEKVRTQFLDLPQARKTCTVLGIQPQGHWGYLHGLNEHHLVLGCATLKTKLRCQGPALLGTDLVRLALERCSSARQAVDLLADLIKRHGQGLFPGCPDLVEGDNVFLIADPREAFALEASGHYWVSQEVRRVRAVSDVSVVRQDWDGIAPGLAALTIDQGWWPGDGTKVDFAGALSTASTGLASGLRRWGRATLLLEEQNGHIDLPFLRRLLSDHYKDTRDEADLFEASDGPTPLCRHAGPAAASATAGSYIASLQADRLALLWCAFGPPCSHLYFPLFLVGEVPVGITRKGTFPWGNGLIGPSRHHLEKIGSGREARQHARTGLADLQNQIDQETSTFLEEAAVLQQQGHSAELHRQAGFFMQHTVELFDKWLLQQDAPGPLRVAVHLQT
jgi:secernin